MTTEYLVHYADERVSAFRRQAWVDSLCPSRRDRLAGQLHRFADHLGAHAQGGSARRRAY